MGDKNLKIKITIGVLLVFTGIIIISWNYLLEKKNQVYDTMYYEIASLPSYIENQEEYENEKVEEQINDIKNNEDNSTSTDSKNNSNKSSVSTSKDDYLGRLMIPKINFNRSFYKIDSVYNDVDKNIQVMKGSSLPDVDGGNLIIAGHSGNVWYSFFKNLYKLKKGNNAYVYYNDTKYTYKVVDIYNVKKNGKVTIKRDRTKRTMTLITCTKNSKTLQTVYILEQVGEE
jgi:sortase A